MTKSTPTPARIHTPADAQQIVDVLIDRMPYAAVAILGGDVTGIKGGEHTDTVRFRGTREDEAPQYLNRTEAAKRLFECREQFNVQTELLDLREPQEATAPVSVTYEIQVTQSITLDQSFKPIFVNNVVVGWSDGQTQISPFGQAFVVEHYHTRKEAGVARYPDDQDAADFAASEVFTGQTVDDLGLKVRLSGVEDQVVRYIGGFVDGD